MEYHDEFSFRLLSFIIDQVKLLCISEQAHQYSVNIIRIKDMEAVIFQTLPLPPTKNEKTTVDNFFYFGGFVACLLLHFICLRKQKPSFTAITLPSSLELIVSNYSVFIFLRYQNSS